jgi:hypothetical protein
LTARWTLTAATSCFALALGVVLGIPDQIFATVTHYAFLAAVATVGADQASRLTCHDPRPGRDDCQQQIMSKNQPDPMDLAGAWPPPGIGTVPRRA